MSAAPASGTDPERDAGARSDGTRKAPRVAYVMSRFPKITETFVLYEMKALEDLGARVEVFPLLRQPAGERHPEALAYEERAHFVPFSSAELLRANLGWLRRDPRRYLETWARVLHDSLGSLNFFLGVLAYFPKCVVFADRVRELGVDHVHAHFSNHPAMAARVIHRLTGVPYSFTAHGSDLHVDRTMLPEKVAEAAFVVTVSRYNRDLIVDECGEAYRDKVVVIHCGADPSVFASVGGTRPARCSKNRAVRVACVASFEEVKGHRYLLEACKMLERHGVDFALDLAGGGPLRDETERLSRDLGLSSRVRFHGPVPRAEVRRILAEADIAVLASHPTKSGKREGIPVALMEAMMSGLPVVASGLSGIPELVDDGVSGFLVPPGDPWALADRLGVLAARPDLRFAMGAAGRDKVLSDFDLPTGARLLLRRMTCRASTSRFRDT